MNKKFTSFALLIVTALATLGPSAHAQIPRELTRILALGDSITEGFDSSGAGIQSYRLPLTNALDITACNYQMVGRRTKNVPDTGFSSPHEGYSGHGIEYFLEDSFRLAQPQVNPGIEAIIGDAQPDVVLIHLGSNDMNRQQTVASTASELNQLITRIWNVKSDIQIYVANVIPWFGSSNNPNIGADINSLGPAFRTVVDNFNSNQIHYVNVKNGFQQSDMQGDGIHPNSDGDIFIANAFLSAINSNNDCPTPPITFISSPSADDQFLPAIHTFTGTAWDTDGDGIQRVRIAIEDNNHTNSSNQWFNFATGQFSSYSESVAALTNATPSTVNWSKSVTLPGGGSYRFYALAVDTLGNQDYFNRGVWPTSTSFFTVSDNVAPTTVVTTPATDGSIIAPGQITLAGTASDTGGSGFDFVQIALRDRNTGNWFNFSNNSFSGAVGSGAIAANLSSTTLTSTNWSRNVALSQGSYLLRVRTFDNQNNVSPWSTRLFNVETSDNIAPTTAITTPATNGTTVGSGQINMAGTASDTGGSGIDFIQLALRHRTTGNWYNFSNNSFSGAVGNGAISINPSNPNANSANWSRNITLSQGPYTLVVRTFDNQNNVSPWSTRLFNVVTPDNTAPTAVITTPVAGVTRNSGGISLTGSASDTGGSGLDFVQIALRDRNTGNWFNFWNGSFSGAAGNGAISAILLNTSANSTDWRRNVVLPTGNYTLVARSFDNQNNKSPWVTRVFNVQ